MLDPETAKTLGTLGTIVGTYIVSKKQIDNLLSPTTKTLGDELKNWATSNLHRLKENTGKIMIERKAKPREIPLADALPIIEAASKTDDETLADLFARLLATQLDSERHNEVHTSFAKLIGEISALDAKLLWVIDEIEAKQRVPEWVTIAKLVSTAQTSIAKELTASEVILSATNLVRVGLLRQGLNVSVTLRKVSISQFGSSFLIACSNDKAYWRKSSAAAREQLRDEEASISSSAEQERLRQEIRKIAQEEVAKAPVLTIE